MSFTTHMKNPVLETSSGGPVLCSYAGSWGTKTPLNMSNPSTALLKTLSIRTMMNNKPVTLGADVTSHTPVSRGSRSVCEPGQSVLRDYPFQINSKKPSNYQLRSISSPLIDSSYSQKPQVDKSLRESDTEISQIDSPPPITNRKKSSRRSLAPFKQVITKEAPKVQASKKFHKPQRCIALLGEGGSLSKCMPASYRPRRQSRAREVQRSDEMGSLQAKASRISEPESQGHLPPCVGDVALMKTPLRNSAVPCVVLNVFKSMYSEGDDECVVAFLLEPRHATCRPAQLHSLARQEVECLADTVVAVAGKTSQPLRCEDAECVSDSTAAYADLLCPAKALTQSLRTKKRVRRIYERVRTAILQSHGKQNP